MPSKRKRQLCILFDLLEDEEHNINHYSNDRSDSVFESLSEIQFHERFRMSKLKFDEIVILLQGYSTTIEEKDFRHKLFIFISYISCNSVLRHLREQWGMIHSTLFRRIEEISDFFI